MRHWIWLACSVAVAATASGPSALAARSPDPAAGGAGISSADVPLTRTVKTRRYSMSGHVRPLLFWMGKDDIGLARIVWRAGDAGSFGYDFLVGTDPSRAPRALNRWGYISETVSGAEASMLALMTGADEGSYDEAAASATAAKSAGDFRAIESQVRGSVASWQVARVRTTNALTVHDLDEALNRVRGATVATKRREMTLTGNASGFLAAVAQFVDGACRGSDSLTKTRRQYVFGQGMYEMSVRRSERASSLVGTRRVPSVHTEFEVRTLATGARTRFEITSGTDAELVGVPIEIAWQPRWWLKVELHLASEPRS